MRAFVYQADENLNDKLGTGIVTNEYKSKKNLLKFGVDPLPSGNTYNVYVFSDWSKRYDPNGYTESFVVIK